MRKLERNIFRLFAGIIVCANLSVFDSSAQSYPVKSIRILVGFAAGGGTDVTARLVAQKLSENLGRPVIVENRPGASGSIANERVATSPPDGYTLLMVTTTAATEPALRPKGPYDLERDLAPVSLVTVGVWVLVVHPSVPARNVKELIALARSQPGKLSYASSGIGSSSNFLGELFNLMAKVKIVHVPYKGGAESSISVASGQAEMAFPDPTSALALLEVRKLRALAVTRAKRSSLMPSIPTLDESGLPGYDRSSWYGLAVPAGVPKEIIMLLNAAVVKVVNTPEMKESFNKQGIEPQSSTPEQFAAIIHRDIVQNVKLAMSMGIKAE